MIEYDIKIDVAIYTKKEKENRYIDTYIRTICLFVCLFVCFFSLRFLLTNDNNR